MHIFQYFCVKSFLTGNMTLDLASFENLYYTYSPRLFNYAVRFLHDRQIAEDIVHEAFIKLWDKYQNRECENFAPLVFVIVRNKCLDYLKQKTLRQGLLQDISENGLNTDQLYSLDFGVEDIMLYKELDTEIRRIVSTLPEKCREIFTASRLEGLKNKEIARKYGISEKMVEKHISRALKGIRKELDSRENFNPTVFSILLLLAGI